MEKVVQIEHAQHLVSLALGESLTPVASLAGDVCNREEEEALLLFYGQASGVQQLHSSPEPSRYIKASPLLHLAQDRTYTSPLAWWKENESVYPRLAILAKRYLAIMASSAPVERVFSTSGWLVSKRRCSMKDELSLCSHSCLLTNNTSLSRNKTTLPYTLCTKQKNSIFYEPRIAWREE